MAALCAGALALRAVALLMASHVAGPQPIAPSPLDLALLFDGHLYILIARSFPVPYAGISALLPAYQDPAVVTTWFPFYPLWIAAFDLVTRDLRLAALAVSQLSAALAVGLFFSLARRWLRAPVLAAALFACFPATWVLCGTLAYTEPLLLLLALAAVACFLRERLVAAALLAGLAAVTQKNGFLLVPIFGLWLLQQHGARGALRRGLPLLVAALPAALLQLHLFFLFGDPLANVQQTRGIYATSFFALPFEALLRGWLQGSTLDPDFFWTQKLLILASFVFYAGALVAGWRARAGEGRLLWTWLAVVLAFHVCLGGHWAYYNFPRFMLLGAPPALVLWLLRFEERLPRWRAALPVLLAPASVWIAALAARSAVRLFLASGMADYFRVFRERVL